MYLDETSIENLMNAINSNPPQKSTNFLNNPNENSKYDFGSVWHGDFFSNTEWGRFGSVEKPNHYGMISDRRKKLIRRPTRRIAPITSRQTGGKQILELSAGEIKTSHRIKSYVILRYKLIVRNLILDNSFEYVQRLSDDYINEARRILNNG